MNTRISLAALSVAWLIAGCGQGGSTTTVGLTSGDQTVLADPTSRCVNGGFPGDPVEMIAQTLNLSDDQKAQAQDIFDRMHTDLDALHDQAHTDIRNVLTADQQAKLDEIIASHQPPDGMPAGQRPIGPPPDGAMGMMPPAGFGFGPPPMLGDPEQMQQTMLDQLAQDLGLTDDQKAQIQTIQDNLHTAVDARRQQAITELKAILTADQQAQLDQLLAKFP